MKLVTLPKLLSPWNAYDESGEHAFLDFVHTIKKKIL